MRLRGWIMLAVLGTTLLGTVFAFQRGTRGSLRDLMEEEDNPAPIPADANEKTEFVFARLRYPMSRGSFFYRRGSWSTDYPKADRQFVQGVRRLTRIHTRSIEQVVDFDGDEVFDYPWMYITEVGHWDWDERQAKRFREYLLKGGFAMTDDFHGSDEWEVFTYGLNKVLPHRPVVDLQNKEHIFHVLYDLDDRFQVPGIQMFYSGSPYEQDGVEAKWRGVYDDKGRVVMAICHNMDLGDAWEWADWPRYPEKYASLAYRIGVNYIIYAMTH